MKYKNLIKLNNEQFRRKVGVKRHTFNMMLKVLKDEDDKKKKIGGAPSKLSIEKKLLITLEYLREYRTLFHIATDNDISESYCSRLIRKVENILIFVCILLFLNKLKSCVFPFEKSKQIISFFLFINN